LLVDRRYMPLWPELEAKAGPGLKRQLTDELQSLEAAHRSRPGHPSLVKSLVDALRSAGRPADAATFAAPVTADMQRVGRIQGDAFWTVNAQAYALAEAGRLDEADALMRRLLALGVNEHPDLVSMAINRSAILLDYGRPGEALKAVEQAEAYGEEAVSAYGRMWMEQVRTCALRTLGRTAEADLSLKRVGEGRRDNPAAYTSALLCHGRLDDVEQAILDRLADPSEREAMLAALQDYQVSQSPAHTATMLERFRSVRDRPRVRGAIERVGRIIPVAAPRTYWGHF
jgi:tetratricopeptide (TPR) repeat protein